MITKVISGGQTGADQAGLRAAKQLGIATGGWVPKGCRTDDGPAPWLVTEFGCQEHPDSQYAPRTVANVRVADGTLWFGDDTSPGGRLTCGTASGDQRPLLKIGRLSLQTLVPVDIIRGWLAHYQIKTLNVAGNRESTMPGIGAAVESLLREVFRATEIH